MQGVQTDDLCVHRTVGGRIGNSVGVSRQMEHVRLTFRNGWLEVEALGWVVIGVGVTGGGEGGGVRNLGRISQSCTSSSGPSDWPSSEESSSTSRFEVPKCKVRKSIYSFQGVEEMSINK